MMMLKHACLLIRMRCSGGQLEAEGSTYGCRSEYMKVYIINLIVPEFYILCSECRAPLSVDGIAMKSMIERCDMIGRFRIAEQCANQETDLPTGRKAELVGLPVLS